VIVTNIDNVLRPKLVPKDAKLNGALTILSVFAGIKVFGFLGIVVGPIIMILITTTVNVYVQVFDKKAANTES
jgi:predicted PurR-regulated permease PerM